MIFVLPISLFDTASTTYVLEELNANEPPYLIISNSFGEPDPIQIDKDIAVLIPSHFTDGGKEYRTIDGKKVAGFFTILPTTLFPDEGSYPVHVGNSASESLISITFHPDR